jgi:hypothetical protein
MKKCYLESMSREISYMKYENVRLTGLVMDDLKDRKGYSHFKEEALDRTVWRSRFGRGFGPVVRQNTD